MHVHSTAAPWAALLLLATACGRIGYDPLAVRDGGPPGPEDAGMDAAVAPVPTTLDLLITLGSVGSDHASGLTVDSDGNFTVCGRFEGDLAVDEELHLTGRGGNDGFAIRFSPTGTVLWQAHLAGPGDDVFWGVTAGPDGRVYAAGRFSGGATLNGLPIASSGAVDGIVVAIDPNGDIAWQRIFGGAGSGDNANGVAVDGAANVYFTGWMDAPFDFGEGVLTPVNEQDIVVGSYTPTGDVRFARIFGAAASDQGAAISVGPSGQVGVAGSFWGSTDLGAGSVTSSGMHDGFLMTLDSEGAPDWSRTWGDAESDVAIDVSVGEAAVFVVGRFDGSLDLLGTRLDADPGFDGYVAAFTSDGNLRWARQLADTGVEGGIHRVAAGASGGCHVVGEVGASGTLGGFALSTVGDEDALWAQLDADGNVLTARTWGSVQDDTASALALGPRGEVYVAGRFNTTTDFEGSVRTPMGFGDVFLLRLVP